MGEMLGKILPIILLMALGYIIRQKNIISKQGIAGIRFLVVNISLSSMLFLLFLEMEFELQYLYIFLLTFALLVVMMLSGFLLNLVKPLYSKYNPFVTSGCAFALVGVALFGILFGENRMQEFLVIGLAHELFVWVIYYMVLRIKIGGEKFSPSSLAKIFTSPMLLAIGAGLILNLSGIGSFLSEYFMWQSFVGTVDMVASTATPLMLILLGYGLAIEKKYLTPSVKLLVSRYIVAAVVGTAFILLVVNTFFENNPMVRISFISLMIIPPIFSLQLLVGTVGGSEEDEKVISNTLAMGSVVGIVLLVLYAYIVA